MDENIKKKFSSYGEKYTNMIEIISNNDISHNVPKTKQARAIKPQIPQVFDITTHLCIKWNLIIHEQESIHNKIRELTKSACHNYDYSQAYIKFTKSVDWTDNLCALHSFDLNAYALIFNNDYKDTYILKFIKNLINDPINYDKENKSVAYEITKFAYAYCHRIGLKEHQTHLKQKLCENAQLNRSFETAFAYKIVNDPILDVIFIKSHRLNNLFDESKYLNSIYKAYIDRHNVSKNMFDLFFNRMSAGIKSIDSEFLIDFIRKTFLYNTVLCNLISLCEVLSLPISMLEKLAFRDKYTMTVFNFYYTILSKVNLTPDIYDTALKILYNNSKYFKEFYKIIIYTQNCIGDFITVIKDNRDSFNINRYAILNISDILQRNIEQMDIKKSLQTLKITLEVLNVIKHEFIVVLSDKVINIMMSLICNAEKVLNNKNLHIEGDEAFFYNWIILNHALFCSVLSAFSLSVYCHDDGRRTHKKKKSACSAQSIKSPALLKLMVKIRKLEFMINQNRNKYNIKDEIILLKNKSFIINESANH